MTRFVQFVTLDDGVPVFVDPQHVAALQAGRMDEDVPSTVIILTSGEKLRVKCTVTEAVVLIEQGPNG